VIPALAAVLAVVAALAAQEPVSKQEESAVDTIRVSVDVVNIFFAVKDKRGAPIPGLTKEDFQIYEEGRPETVKYFSAESNQPLTLGLLIDTSGSQQRVLRMEQQVGAAFLTDVVREKDLAFVISFDVNVDLLQDFTSSTRRLRAALERTRINTGGGSGVVIPGGGGNPVPTANQNRGTLLFDAIYLAAGEKLGREVGRKAMIILTDGADYGSQVRLADAIEEAQRADAICYVLLIDDRGFYGNWGYSGDRDMKKLTEETGGRVIQVGDKMEKLKEAFDQIARELRSQYSIGYSPSNTNRDGSFRRIDIKSRQGHKVQARRGYYARRD